MLDASLSKALKKIHTTFTIGAKNILDVKNISASIAAGVHSPNANSAQVAMGRTYFISIRYSFDKP
jgi:outer membrane receptor protein involved in Fe transport